LWEDERKIGCGGGSLGFFDKIYNKKKLFHLKIYNKKKLFLFLIKKNYFHYFNKRYL